MTITTLSRARPTLRQSSEYSGAQSIDADGRSHAATVVEDPNEGTEETLTEESTVPPLPSVQSTVGALGRIAVNTRPPALAHNLSGGAPPPLTQMRSRNITRSEAWRETFVGHGDAGFEAMERNARMSRASFARAYSPSIAAPPWRMSRACSPSVTGGPSPRLSHRVAPPAAGSAGSNSASNSARSIETPSPLKV